MYVKLDGSGNIIMNISEMTRILGKYYKIYINKLDNLEEADKSLVTYNLTIWIKNKYKTQTDL